MGNTTAAQLITFLQKLPPDTKIEVLEEWHRNWDTSTNFIDLELPEGDPKSDCTNTCDLIGSTLYLGKR